MLRLIVFLFLCVHSGLLSFSKSQVVILLTLILAVWILSASHFCPQQQHHHRTNQFNTEYQSIFIEQQDHANQQQIQNWIEAQAQVGHNNQGEQQLPNINELGIQTDQPVIPKPLFTQTFEAKGRPGKNANVYALARVLQTVAYLWSCNSAMAPLAPTFALCSAIFSTPAASLLPPAPPQSDSSIPAETLSIQDLLPGISHPDDSHAQMFVIRKNPESTVNDPITYELCSYQNVCAGPDGLYMQITNYTEWQHYNELFESCFTATRPRTTQGQYSICHCFYPQFKPKLLPFVNVDNVAEWPKTDTVNVMSYKNPGHYASFHKYVNRHHIAHWAQKLVLFSSAYEHSNILPDYVAPLSGMIFHDTDLPISDHEQAILNMTIQAILSKSTAHTGLQEYLQDIKSPHNNHADSNLVFWKELEDRMIASKPMCYDRLTFTRSFGIFSSNSADTVSFRNAAYSMFDIPLPVDRCPPRRAVLIYRENRRIINEAEIVKLLKDEFNVNLELQTINQYSTSAQQVSLFASTGLLLSSHSSQMINVLFSRPSSAMIEISAEFYNADFGEYAHGMGVFFQYALGGTVPDGVIDQGQKQCVQVLNTCQGDSHCILQRRFKCGHRGGSNKNLNFIADLNSVRIAVRHSIEHLNWACGGKW